MEEHCNKLMCYICETQNHTDLKASLAVHDTSRNNHNHEYIPNHFILRNDAFLVSKHRQNSGPEANKQDQKNTQQQHANLCSAVQYTAQVLFLLLSQPQKANYAG